MTIILTSLFWIWALPVILIFLVSLILDKGIVAFTAKDVKEILLWPYYVSRLLIGNKK